MVLRWLILLSLLADGASLADGALLADGASPAESVDFAGCLLGHKSSACDPSSILTHPCQRCCRRVQRHWSKTRTMKDADWEIAL